MQRSKIGELDVSIAGLGCNNFGHDHFETRLDESSSSEIIRAAFDCGISLFDTSDAYEESEEYLGRALKDHRDEVILSTKFGAFFPPNGLRPGDPRWVKEACHASLGRLGTDRIDIYMIHHPDPKTPIVDTLGALSDLVGEGKIREIGCSNFTASMIREADTAADDIGAPHFVIAENNYSLLNRIHETDVIPTCQQLGLSIEPYFPLASGMLTGKYRRGETLPPDTRFGKMARANRSDHFPDLFTDESFSIVENLEKYATEHEHSLIELALSWLSCNPIVSCVIAGATSVDQVRSNAAATTAWDLSAEELADIDRMTALDRAFTVSFPMQSGHLAEELRRLDLHRISRAEAEKAL